ncbi:hypothetical protein LQW54_000870 [Pestalotiopsis sp. IQ-011]
MKDKKEDRCGLHQLREIKTSSTDILIILDCCFAAQAGRSRDEYAGRVEVLAASAMGMETPRPGPQSFTSILITEMTKALKEQGYVDVRALHGSMCDRKTQLWATPVHMSLHSTEDPIRLRPLLETTVLESESFHEERNTGSFLHLLLEVNNDLGPYQAEEIGRWLGAHTPRIVSKVIFQTTTKLGQAVKDIQKGTSNISAHLDGSAREDIMMAWNNVIELVERYHAKEHGQTLQQDLPSSKSRQAYDFLRKLDMNNDTVRNTIERNLLCAPDIDGDAAALDEAVDNENFAELSLADQVQMRRMICHYDMSHSTIENVLSDSGKVQSAYIVEEKRYSPYIDPAELPSLVARVALLNHPFLLGFDFARPHSDPSIGRAEDNSELNIYRHPSRQGNMPRSHRKIHDLYSLGVVLLEIGLWQTAKDMTRRSQGSSTRPEDIQKLLQKAASGRIAHYAGESYQSAVCVCLDSAFEVEMDDDKGSHLARAFDRKVVQRIMKGISLG